MCKKKQPPPKHSNVGFLSNLRMNQLFPLDISGRVWGQKPTGWTWAHRTETEIRTKAHRLIFFPSISVMSPLLLTTPGLPSHHLFTYFHPSSHLGRIQHNTRQQCLPLCVIFSTTRNGRVCLMLQYDSVWISVPTSPSHNMAMFASGSYSLSSTHCHSTVQQYLFLCINLTFT